jgi:hypothetical protein
MESLYPLERAVLEAIARQVPDHRDALSRQLRQARVVARKNTGVGFYTTLDTSSDDRLCGVASPVGNVGAWVDLLSTAWDSCFGCGTGTCTS